MANSALSGNTSGLATSTSPGLVGTGAQTFAGNKTFTGTVAASNLKAPTQTIYTSGSGTYTVPAGVIWLRVRMVGGGGGGGPSALGSTANAATDGTATTFGSSLLTCNGGKGVIGNGSSYGAGGTATIGAGASGIASIGQDGQYGYYQGAAYVNAIGGSGGSTPLGNGGIGGPYGAGSPGLNAYANSGGGGGGGGTPQTGATDQRSGGGGGGGGYIDAIIPTLSASYSYSVGTGGTGATAGPSGAKGGNGAAGIIIIEEHYS